MKPLLLVAALALSGCNVARFTHVPPQTDAAEPARHSSALGEPGSLGWQPLEPGQQYARFVHDPAVANGCNETNSEAPEVDNDGHLCKSVVP